MSEQQLETPQDEAQPTTETTTEDTQETPTSLIGDGDAEKAGQGGEGETLIGGKDDAEGTSVVEALAASDLRLPEGIDPESDGVVELLEVVNAAESRADLVNTLLDEYHAIRQNAEDDNARAWNDLQTAWQDELKAHPEYGGDALKENLAVANTLVTRYGGDKFVEALGMTGMGNNQHFMEFLMKVNADLPQDATPVDGNPAGSGSRSLADRLFSQPNS